MGTIAVDREAVLSLVRRLSSVLGERPRADLASVAGGRADAVAAATAAAGTDLARASAEAAKASDGMCTGASEALDRVAEEEAARAAGLAAMESEVAG